MQCLSYARVSSDEQADKDLSIPAQFKLIRKWAEQRNYEVVKEYSDEESAHKAATKRPGFMEMISYCRKNKINLIIVHKLDRFSRNRMESLFYKEQLRKYKVQVKSVTEDFDPTTPHGFLFESIIEVFNEWFIYNLSSETTKGMRENAERGQYNGGSTPYGFAIQIIGEGESSHRRLVPGNPEEQEVIRSMYRMATEEGMGGMSIARALNHKKISPPKTKGWSKTTVLAILNNPVNVGDLLWRRRVTDTPGGKRRTALSHEIVSVRDALPGIIARATWDRWKALSESRRFDRPQSVAGPSKYLLARLIRCGQCGGNYIGRRNPYKTRLGEVHYTMNYNCSNYQQMGPEVCPSHPIKADVLEGIVLRLLRNHLCRPDAIGELESIVRERISARRKVSDSDPRFVHRKMEEVERRIAHYYRAIGDGLDSAICLSHIKELTAQKGLFQKELESRKDDDLFVRMLEQTLEEIRSIAAKFGSGFYELPIGAQRRLLLHFVEGLEVQEHDMLLVKLKVPADTRASELLAEEEPPSESDGGVQGSGVMQYGSAREGSALLEKPEPKGFRS